MDNQQKADVTGSVVKKKKVRFFETYISKVMKQVSPSNGITSNARQQVNSVLCMIAKVLCQHISNLTELAKKKTISAREVLNAVKILLPGELSNNAVTVGERSVTKFNEADEEAKGNSRQHKAGILFPPSVTEKFIRNFGYFKIMVTSTAPVCLAAILEYLSAEILEVAANAACDNRRVRITIRDLELGVRNDAELNELFINMNISFLGGGRIPYIHQKLLCKKPRKKQKGVATPIPTETPTPTATPLGEKKPHRFRPGTVAIREIKKYQKISNCLIFAKFPFEKLVRQIVSTLHNDPNIKISKDVFTVLQYFIEQYIVNVLHAANFAAIHAGRVKLMSADIVFTQAIRKGLDVPLNYKLENNLISCDERITNIPMNEELI